MDDFEFKRQICYRTASGDANCSNCEHTATLNRKLRCAFSPDVQFWAANYMYCDEHAFVAKEKNP